MELNKSHFIGIGIGLFLIVLSLLLSGNALVFLMGIGFFVLASPFAFSLIHEANVTQEKEEMFLEFSRNLVESVKAGNPVSRSIINLRERNYGFLSPHVKKLASQISMGIPFSHALDVFSKDIDNKAISRALTLIGQAERSGGDIGEILESVVASVNLTDKLKKEQKASVSTLVMQGYIIFLVFIIIVLVMQFRIIPLVSGLGGDITDSQVIGSGVGGGIDPQGIANAFLYLLLVQGFFSGLTIGKLAEGNIKNGVRHSVTLMLMAFLISATANLLFS